MGAGRPASLSSPASTLVGSAVTLVLGVIVAGVLYVMGDGPGEYFGNESFRIIASALALLVAPVGLLVAWDEIDLSSFGTAALGSYVYAEVADDSVLPGLVLAALVGLAVGAAIGVVRWLTGAHPALVSLGAGALVSGIALRAGPGPAGMTLGSRIEGWSLPLVAMLAVVGLAVGLAVIFHDPPARASGLAGPRVVPGFALSGLAAGLYGAFLASSFGFYSAGQVSQILILVFAAVAIGGVVRGSGPVAPLVAALGAVIVVVVQDAAVFNDWQRGEGQIVLGGLFVVCVAVAHGIRRVMAPPTPPPSGPF